jgi:hypothetical protein
MGGVEKFSLDEIERFRKGMVRRRGVFKIK